MVDDTVISLFAAKSNPRLLSFVASNWKTGWVGALMTDVIQSLGLKDAYIEAMTQANFSNDTDPTNPVFPTVDQHRLKRS